MPWCRVPRAESAEGTTVPGLPTPSSILRLRRGVVGTRASHLVELLTVTSNSLGILPGWASLGFTHPHRTSCGPAVASPQLYLFRKIELASSWLRGGRLELAAIFIGLKKHKTSVDRFSTYSRSLSTSWKQTLLRVRMLCACGDRM